MTERHGASPPQGPRAHTVAWLSGCAFLAVLALLGYQLRSGDDPALRNMPASASTSQTPRRVLLRKIVRKIVVVHVIPAEQPAVAGGSTAAGPAAAPSGGTGSATPATSAPAASAPVAAAPAPVAAAPAPAPVTRTS